MTSLPSRVVALALCIAAGASGVVFALQDPAPQTPSTARPQEPNPGQVPAAGRGEGGGAPGGGGRGRGGPAANALGDGPFEIQTETGPVRLTVVTKGLDHPWGLAFLPDGSMLVTERPGRLRVVRNGVLDPTPIAGVPQVRSAVLGGLLDIALHPAFAENRLLLSLLLEAGDRERGDGDGGGRARALGRRRHIDRREGHLRGRAVLRRAAAAPALLRTGSAGWQLRVSARVRPCRLSLRHHRRSQLRREVAGSVVSHRQDRPPARRWHRAAGQSVREQAGFRPEIYTLGHRNPLGLTVHPVTGELWSTEFGPRGGDELNRIQAGKNYGWIDVTKGAHYDKEPPAKGNNSVPGMEDPVLFWAPSTNPGNLIFYNGDRFPAWKGNMLMATMSRFVLRATFDAQEKPVAQERMLTELKQRFRDVRLGPDGFIYLLTDETAGAILRLEPMK